MEIAINDHTLMLSGDFDVRSTWEVRAALYEHLATYEDDVVVDLSGVENVDVTALRVLAVATRRAASYGRHVRLRGCGPAVRRMLHLSRMARLLEMEPQAVA